MKRVILCMMFMVIAVNAVNVQAAEGVNVSLVNQNPDPARAGDLVEMRFMVENKGSREINNLEFSSF